jgi:polysaccharide export outer membrane protein
MACHLSVQKPGENSEMLGLALLPAAPPCRVGAIVPLFRSSEMELHKVWPPLVRLHRSQLAIAVLITVLTMHSLGCASRQQDNPAATDSPSVLSSTNGPAGGQAIERIWDERQNDSYSPDFAIGPGDVMEISAPDLEEIKDRTERVSANGTISLPIAGEVHVGGLTEKQARQAIEAALSRLVKDPQVDVFVKEYNSREVAIMGMVNKPGLYPLISRSNTILDLIGQAGGMNGDASNVVLFIPALATASGSRVPSQGVLDALASQQEASKTANAGQLAQLVPENGIKPISAETPLAATRIRSPMDLAALSSELKESNPIYINIVTLNRDSHENLPVRPGDVIIVPAVGEVLVQGWVGTPGAYHITPGMTALAAVTAAGGQQFSSRATVLRAGPNGDKIDIPVNLSKVEKGEEPDIAVQSGDVVIVNRSAAGAIPYSFYFLMSHFGTGLALPVF